MKKLQQVLFWLERKHLVYWEFFGRKTYMRHTVRLYKKHGVTFEGSPCFIAPDATLDVSGPIQIGKDVIISSNSLILTHDVSIRYQMLANGYPKEHESMIVKGVKIGDETFIGQRSIILPGIIIGNNCIIGAGAVVTKNVPDNSIVEGCPAHIIDENDKDSLKKRLSKFESIDIKEN